MDYGDIYTFINRNQSKPLNVQIEEMIDYLGGYNLVASDEVYFTSNNAAFTVPSGIEADAASLPFSLKFNIGGTAKIKISTSNARCRTRVYINNVKSSEYIDGLTQTMTATVNKGDVVSFKV